MGFAQVTADTTAKFQRNCKTQAVKANANMVRGTITPYNSDVLI